VLDVPTSVEHVKKALARAEDVAVEMVRQGKIDCAMKTVFGAIREALAPLVESVGQLTADISELRGIVKELMNGINALGREVNKLTVNVNSLAISVRELKERTLDLERGARELRWGLEKEVELRRKVEGEIGRLRGYMLEALLGERLADWCAKHGLALEYLPREYRADAAIMGKRLVALVQIAEVGEERDVEQLLEGAEIYEREEGVRPHALVLYVRTKWPPESVIKLCEEHGIMLETSPRRIALKLEKLDRELATNS